MRATIFLRAILGPILGPILGAIGMAMLLPPTGASAQVWHGNDTGGIIPWSCENEALAPRAAAGYCARFSKYARITGVHRQYGDYISFNCLWSPNADRFARPAVPTRAACNAEPLHIWAK
jgi:hypothetical protein